MKQEITYVVFDAKGAIATQTDSRDLAYELAETEGYTIQTLTSSDSLGWSLKELWTSVALWFSKIGYTHAH